MFALRLNTRACISCGICMDVCAPRAIAMRTAGRKRVEGTCLVLQHMCTFGEPRLEDITFMTYPYLAIQEGCDGCSICVQQCPVSALKILGGSEGERRQPNCERAMDGPLAQQAG